MTVAGVLYGLVQTSRRAAAGIRQPRFCIMTESVVSAVVAASIGFGIVPGIELPSRIRAVGGLSRGLVRERAVEPAELKPRGLVAQRPGQPGVSCGKYRPKHLWP
jgi:hypothetical protein